MHLWLLSQLQWSNLWKVYVQYPFGCLSPENQVPSGVHDLENGFLSTWHQVRSTTVHNPVLATGESPYPVMIIVGGSGLLSLNIDL